MPARTCAGICIQWIRTPEAATTCSCWQMRTLAQATPLANCLVSGPVFAAGVGSRLHGAEHRSRDQSSGLRGDFRCYHDDVTAGGKIEQIADWALEASRMDWDRYGS
jgi:hypothetical protein